MALLQTRKYQFNFYNFSQALLLQKKENVRLPEFDRCNAAVESASHLFWILLANRFFCVQHISVALGNI